MRYRITETPRITYQRIIKTIMLREFTNNGRYIKIVIESDNNSIERFFWWYDPTSANELSPIEDSDLVAELNTFCDNNDVLRLVDQEIIELTDE